MPTQAEMIVKLARESERKSATIKQQQDLINMLLRIIGYLLAHQR